MYHILYQYFISFNFFFSFKTEFHTAQDDFQLPCSQGCPQAPDPPAYSSRGPESQMFEMTLGIFTVYDLLRRWCILFLESTQSQGKFCTFRILQCRGQMFLPLKSLPPTTAWTVLAQALARRKWVVWEYSPATPTAWPLSLTTMGLQWQRLTVVAHKDWMLTFWPFTLKVLAL